MMRDDCFNRCEAQEWSIIMDTKAAQKRIYQNKLNQGFNVTDMHLQFLHLHTETSEAYEAWSKKKDDFGLELADIAIYLMGIAEMQGIDLGAEIERKMEINEKRRYMDIDGVFTKFEGKD